MSVPWRRFAMGPLAGMAAIVEAELSVKLEREIRFDFSGLWRTTKRGGPLHLPNWCRPAWSWSGRPGCPVYFWAAMD